MIHTIKLRIDILKQVNHVIEPSCEFIRTAWVITATNQCMFILILSINTIYFKEEIEMAIVSSDLIAKNACKGSKKSSSKKSSKSGCKKGGKKKPC